MRPLGPSDSRGRREDRVSTDTHGPRAIKKHGEGTTGSAGYPAFPAQWLYGLYVLSPVTGLSCHRRRAISLAQLGLSVGRPGPHDFAVRASTGRLAQKRLMPPRPSHPASRFVTIAIRPSHRGGTARIMPLIWGRRQAYLRKTELAPTAADWHDGQFTH